MMPLSRKSEILESILAEDSALNKEALFGIKKKKSPADNDADEQSIGDLLEKLAKELKNKIGSSFVSSKIKSMKVFEPQGAASFGSVSFGLEGLHGFPPAQILSFDLRKKTKSDKSDWGLSASSGGSAWIYDDPIKSGDGSVIAKQVDDAIDNFTNPKVSDWKLKSGKEMRKSPSEEPEWW